MYVHPVVLVPVSVPLESIDQLTVPGPTVARNAPTKSVKLAGVSYRFWYAMLTDSTRVPVVIDPVKLVFSITLEIKLTALVADESKL